jgi:hypothetical protein
MIMSGVGRRLNDGAMLEKLRKLLLVVAVLESAALATTRSSRHTRVKSWH